MLRTIIFLVFISSGCASLPVGMSILANTGGTIAGEAIWHKIKKDYLNDKDETKVIHKTASHSQIKKNSTTLFQELGVYDERN